MVGEGVSLDTKPEERQATHSRPKRKRQSLVQGVQRALPSPSPPSSKTLTRSSACWGFGGVKVHICVLSRFSRVQSFTILWTVARQPPLSTGLSRQESRSRQPFPSPGDLPHPGWNPMFPALQVGRLFTAEPPGKPMQSECRK